MLLGVSSTFLLPPNRPIKTDNVSEIQDKIVKLELIKLNKEYLKEVVISNCPDCKLIYNKNTNTFTIQSDKGINTAALTNISLIPNVKIISIYKEINSFPNFRVY